MTETLSDLRSLPREGKKFPWFPESQLYKHFTHRRNVTVNVCARSLRSLSLSKGSKAPVIFVFFARKMYMLTFFEGLFSSPESAAIIGYSKSSDEEPSTNDDGPSTSSGPGPCDVNPQ